MKTLTKLNDDEKIELIKKNWGSPRMIEYITKRYDYYKTNDNMYIEIEKASSLEIVKEFYYDDEYEAPKINFENFLAYNDRVFNRLKYFEERLNTVNVHWYFTKQLNALANINIFTDWELEDNKYRYEFVRELTQEEKEDYLEILKERNEQFLERLKKYYNRYGKNITTHGYWANR